MKYIILAINIISFWSYRTSFPHELGLVVVCCSSLISLQWMTFAPAYIVKSKSNKARPYAFTSLAGTRKRLIPSTLKDNGIVWLLHRCSIGYGLQTYHKFLLLFLYCNLPIPVCRSSLPCSSLIRVSTLLSSFVRPSIFASICSRRS